MYYVYAKCEGHYSVLWGKTQTIYDRGNGFNPEDLAKLRGDGWKYKGCAERSAIDEWTEYSLKYDDPWEWEIVQDF